MAATCSLLNTADSDSATRSRSLTVVIVADCTTPQAVRRADAGVVLSTQAKKASLPSHDLARRR
eukprot:CAMPEP_0185158814 /NCGR_PEP_ID=MMETSP1139-20130426/2650_1 /TAXON_ID=298111 /ORGANISM="Pavlova sp., Strain CCMP459" /LENGTH=63 /DNA_ID=CAMNT_0027723963 /DNA_START=112 /DNA_END=299 /DNA_ORIENTATION=+